MKLQVLLEAEELELGGGRGQEAALRQTALSLQGWSGWKVPPFVIWGEAEKPDEGMMWSSFTCLG